MTEPTNIYPAPAGYPPQQPAPGYPVPGTPVAGYPAQGFPPPGYQGYPGPAQQQYVLVPVTQKRNGMGITAMVLGIVGVVIALGMVVSEEPLPTDVGERAGYAMMMVALGVLALVFGLVGLGRVRRREATAGGQAITGVVLGCCTLMLVGIAFFAL